MYDISSLRVNIYQIVRRHHLEDSGLATRNV